jgi:hypothetical protein
VLCVFNPLSVEHKLLQLDKKTVINPEFFINFLKTHHSMMFPAFNIRAQMQNKVLGVGFWEKASARRTQISKGRYIPVGDLVKLVSVKVGIWTNFDDC